VQDRGRTQEESSFFPSVSVSSAAFLIVVTLAAALLRGLDLAAKSYWIDELISLNHAKDITGWSSFFAPSSGDWNPPLYFLLLKGWLVFGEGESHARMLSAVLGTAVVPATFALARQFFSRQVSLLASLLVAASPLLLLYDRELRSYPLFTLVSVISLYFFVRALREGKMRDWAGYTLFTIAGIYSHYHAFLVILGEILFVCLRYNAYKGRSRLLVVSLAIGAFSYLPMLPTFFIHLHSANELHSAGGKFPVVFGYPAKLLYNGFAFALGQTLLPWKPVAIVGGLAALTFFASGLRELRRRWETAAFFLSCLGVPVVVGSLVSEPTPRHFVFVTPLFCALLALGIMAVSSKALRHFLCVVLGVAWSFGIANYFANRQFHILAQVTPWREAGQFLRAHVTRDDLIIHIALKPKINTEPLSYYAQMHIPVYEQDVIGSLPALTKQGSVPRVWLIVSEASLQETGRVAASWLAGHYAECKVWRYFYDPDFRLKKRLFRKDFSEYRIQIYEFTNPQAVRERAAVSR